MDSEAHKLFRSRFPHASCPVDKIEWIDLIAGEEVRQSDALKEIRQEGSAGALIGSPRI
jgi:hypothetical protein